jgi:DNA-binding MurR/RpiR family transcriptional regulator
VNSTIVDLAERADVSPPTVTRFCRRLECHSFSDFKVKLAQASFVGMRYLKPETNFQSTEELADNIASKAQAAIFSAHGALDLVQIEEIAKRIAEAGTIFAFGAGGNSSMIASEIQNRLFRFGLRVTSSSDHAMQMMLASTAKEGDVVIGSSAGGKNRELADALRVAQSYGAYCVAITASDSLVAEAVDVVVPVDIEEGVNILRPTSIRFAYLMIVDVIATATATRLGTAASEPLRRIKHQLLAHLESDDDGPLGD